MNACRRKISGSRIWFRLPAGNRSQAQKLARSLRLHRPQPPPLRAPAAPAIDGLLVRGLYLFNPKQQEVVVDYFKNLVSSPWFAIDPNNQAKVIRPTTPNNTERAFPYDLRLDLKKPVPLPSIGF